MPNLYESDIEKFAIELLQEQGYVYLSAEEQDDERSGLADVVLRERLRDAIENINPDVPAKAKVKRAGFAGSFRFIQSEFD